MHRGGLLQKRARARCRARNAEGPAMDPCRLGPDYPVEGPDLNCNRSSPRGACDDSLEHFGPKVHAASVLEIIEVAETDIPVAEANLHHPFAVPPIPRDTGKAGPVGLGHGCTSCCIPRTSKQKSCVSTRRSIHAGVEHIIAGDGGIDDAAVGRACSGPLSPSGGP